MTILINAILYQIILLSFGGMHAPLSEKYYIQDNIRGIFVVLVLINYIIRIGKNNVIIIQI